jgi:hypothetical protein|tara:strand:+ start:2877 stop:4889 length:2013 start_codon:yes stop_codon:yes gene_type:complete
MSLRNLLGIGRRFLQKKKESTTPTTGQRTVTEGTLELPPPVPIKEEVQSLIFKPPVVQEALSTAPMQAGNKTFASVAFDRIAQKGAGSYSADDWANWLTDRGKRRIKIFGKEIDEGYITARRFKLDEGFAKGSYLRGKDQTVPLEELFDSNIASFNRAGELTGGLLYTAKQAGVKVPGNVLAEMAIKNPVNRLKAVDYGVPQGVVDNAEQTISLSLQRLRAIEKVIDNSARSSPGSDIQYKAIKDTFTKLKEDIANIRNAIREGNYSSIEGYEKRIAQGMRDAKALSKTQQQKLIFNNIQGQIDDLISSTKGVRGTRYADDATYTLPGGSNYRESFLVLDESIPLNQRPRKPNPHFDDADVANPIVHFRYDTRYTPDGKKVFLIHEIQSDTNQKIAKGLRAAQENPLDSITRTNPYQNDMIIKFLAAERNNLGKQIMSGKLRGNQIELISNKIKNIDEQLKNITTKAREGERSVFDQATGTYKNIKTADPRFDYFPLIDRSSYSSAAIKYLTNKAAKEGVDYVAITPVTYLSRTIDKNRAAGFIQSYGYPKGNKRPGSKTLAAYPDVLKSIAKTFETKAGPIKIAKSDPSRPYKSLKENIINIPGDKKYSITTHTDASKEAKAGYVYIPKEDMRLYEDVFSVKVTPNMAQPQKIYKKFGGFINKNLFRMN